MPACPLLPWVVFPIAYRNDHVLAEGEDAMKFLYNFSSDPLWVSAVAVILIAISVTLIVKKRILRNFLEVRKDIKKQS